MACARFWGRYAFCNKFMVTKSKISRNKKWNGLGEMSLQGPFRGFRRLQISKPQMWYCLSLIDPVFTRLLGRGVSVHLDLITTTDSNWDYLPHTVVDLRSPSKFEVASLLMTTRLKKQNATPLLIFYCASEMTDLANWTWALRKSRSFYRFLICWGEQHSNPTLTISG